MIQNNFTSFILMAISILFVFIIKQASTSTSRTVPFTLKTAEEYIDILKTFDCYYYLPDDDRILNIVCRTQFIHVTITVSNSPNLYFKINCYDSDDFNPVWVLRPVKNIGSDSMLQIGQCGLPQLQIIQTIIQKLEIPQLNDLFLERSKPIAQIHIKGLINLNPPEGSSDVFLRENYYTSYEIDSFETNIQYLPISIDLNLWSNNLRDLSKDALAVVFYLDDLDLSGNNIETLHPDVFIYLKQLRNINLNGNYFKSLPDELFEENKNLSRFHLGNNRVPLKHLPSGLLSNMPNLREVLVSCGLQNISAAIFANSTSIRNITISGNDLTELPLMLFADQIELVDLDLTGNNLTSLSKDAFEGASSLANLDLSANNIETLHPDVFIYLKQLRYINLNGNYFKSLPDELFEENKNLSRFHLGNNRVPLKHLPSGLLSNMPNLREVLVSCGLQNISAAIFANSTSIRNITISGNDLTELPLMLFADQIELVDLDLTGNNLTSLSKDTFEGASSLANLDLSANNIETLHPGVFSNLKQLANINLNGNFFKFLPERIFAKNKNLYLFRLDNNRVPLKHLPSGLLSNLPNLRKVVISCNLQTIPANVFANSKFIENIKISGNNLIKLSDKLFSDQFELIDLDLTRNKLIHLPDDIFQNTSNLKVLRLSRNQLIEVSDQIFSSLQNLEILYMDSNNLLTISSEAFVQTRKLSYINMESNQIQFCYFFFGFLETGDQIEIMSAFHHLPDLRTLNLSNNSIRCIPPELRKTNLKLEKLDLSYNKINMITDIDLLFRSSHIFVNLTHNNITRISFSGIDYADINLSEKKIQILVSYNPLYCDCETLPFLQFLSGHLGSELKDALEVSVKYLKCSGSENLRGRLVQDISPTELICPVEYKRKRCPERCECKARPFDRVLLLNCSNAGFSEVPDLSTLPLEGVSSVADFDLSANNIVTFLPGTFSYLKNLFNINLSGNLLKSLPKRLFAENKKLSLFRLENNRVPLKHLPSGLLSNMPNLREVLFSCGLQSIPGDIFANSTSITQITISGNDFTELPRMVFADQSELITLDLSRNKLVNLSREALEGTPSLSDLDLSANNIDSFHPDSFSYLKQLTNINLSRNYFKFLPQGLFAENKKLSLFRLENNHVPLKHLPSGLLSNLSNLRKVLLGCNLETISDNIFANSTSIRNITISGNDLTELPHNLFADQFELIDLDLTKNKLIHLPDDIFLNTRNLRVLRLSHNQLNKVSNLIFEPLNNLENLYIDNNNVHTINWYAFDGTQKLAYINMENNKISDIIHQFNYLSELRTINLKNNSIPYILTPYDYGRHLESLDLSYNNISMITQGDLIFPNRPIFVNLTHNKITKINFFELDSFFLNAYEQKIQVAVSYNPLSCDCDMASFLQFVKTELSSRPNYALNVSVNELECSSPENLRGRLVQDLSLFELYCPVEIDCPKRCSCIERRFDRFLLVNCTNAGLTEIPELPLAVRYNRTALYVDKNNISSLPNITLPGYETVNWLYANHNIISQIHVQNLPKDLETLDLSHNKLNVLNSSLVEYLYKSQSLGSVSLGNNPWSCECDSEDLLQFVRMHSQKVSDLNQMLCYPDGEKFQFLAFSDICQLEENLVMAISMLVALAGLTLGTLIALYYIYQVEIKVWLYAHNMCLWFVTEEELDKDKIYDAFISFSHQDGDLVADFLVPELESGPTPFKLCVHLRDWIVGEFIPTQIVRSVDESKRTIIVLSRHFIESVWGRMEFRTAHSAALNEGRARVIVIIRGDIGSVDDLDPELRAYLKMNTYLKWGDPWFWDKLRYAMPHPSKNTSGIVNNALNSSTHGELDNFELSPVININAKQNAVEDNPDT